MIRGGAIPFLGVPISLSDFCCVGTPGQLHDFLRRLKKKENHHFQPRKQRFCFDLDMTLVGAPKVAGDYSTCPPIWRNIELVQQLHDAGHHIIIVRVPTMSYRDGDANLSYAANSTPDENPQRERRSCNRRHRSHELRKPRKIRHPP